MTARVRRPDSRVDATVTTSMYISGLARMFVGRYDLHEPRPDWQRPQALDQPMEGNA
jgi:hypothetical protein